MGKLAGAALTVAAPEAKVATKAAAAASGKAKGKPGPLRHQPTNLNDLPADWHEEELQGRKADARWAADERKAGRDPDRATVSGEEPPAGEKPAAADPAPAPSGAGPSLPAMPAAAQAAASTGSGILLGLFTWGLVLSYLGVNGDSSGAAGVRAFLAAKFLNKV